MSARRDKAKQQKRQGVVIASLFRDLDNNRLLIYMLGLFVAFTVLGVGLVLTDKKKGK